MYPRQRTSDPIIHSYLFFHKYHHIKNTMYHTKRALVFIPFSPTSLPFPSPSLLPSFFQITQSQRPEFRGQRVAGCARCLPWRLGWDRQVLVHMCDLADLAAFSWSSAPGPKWFFLDSCDSCGVEFHQRNAPRDVERFYTNK